VRRMTWLLAVATIVTSLASPAMGRGNKSGRQTVRGQVKAPSPAQCVNGAVVDATLHFAVRSDPVFTDGFKVATATGGEPFTLESHEEMSDLDIVFLLVGAESTSFETRGLGGEAGVVPADAVRAYVCAIIGADVSFTYRAG